MTGCVWLVMFVFVFSGIHEFTVSYNKMCVGLSLGPIVMMSASVSLDIAMTSEDVRPFLLVCLCG